LTDLYPQCGRYSSLQRYPDRPHLAEYLCLRCTLRSAGMKGCAFAACTLCCEVCDRQYFRRCVTTHCGSRCDRKYSDLTSEREVINNFVSVFVFVWTPAHSPIRRAPPKRPVLAELSMEVFPFAQAKPKLFTFAVLVCFRACTTKGVWDLGRIADGTQISRDRFGVPCTDFSDRIPFPSDDLFFSVRVTLLLSIHEMSYFRRKGRRRIHAKKIIIKK
jgi:hypothetical protein